ncbi:hypothetical protein ColTof4_14099 [Colletotrichum tofieldiae]|nr:hypothetical protein ColTof3_02985 [Colletotrichum tofieldiae]GKT81676.1 hypothetical protein ColTof4_14099 [Colletotrichum tofieldiae]
MYGEAAERTGKAAGEGKVRLRSKVQDFPATSEEAELWMLLEPTPRRSGKVPRETKPAYGSGGDRGACQRPRDFGCSDVEWMCHKYRVLLHRLPEDGYRLTKTRGVGRYVVRCGAWDAGTGKLRTPNRMEMEL